RHATHHEQLRHYIQHILSRNAPRHHQRHTFARVLVHDRQPLQRPPTRRAVEDEIPSPHVVGMLGPTPRTPVGTVPQLPLFPGFCGTFGAFGPPQPIPPFAIPSPPPAPE